MEKITDRSIEFFNLDINDRKALDDLFNKYKFYAVLHLAASKAVGESVEKPLKYYKNNVAGTVNVLEVIFEFFKKGIFYSFFFIKSA